MRGGGAIWERSRGPLSPSDIHQAVNIRPPPVMQPIGPDWQGGYIHDIRLEGGGRGVRSVCVCVDRRDNVHCASYEHPHTALNGTMSRDKGSINCQLCG